MAIRVSKLSLLPHRAHDGFKIVLLRHGQSEWNSSKRFSGWMDIDLTEKGRQQVFPYHNSLLYAILKYTVG